MEINHVDTCSMVLPVDEHRTLHVVYELQAVLTEGQPPETIFVSSCKLNDVFQMKDAKKNSEFLRLFGNGGSVLVRIVCWSTDAVVMRRCAIEHIRKMPKKPLCNDRGRKITGARKVRHIETGDTYDTQAEAAHALGIHASAISRHLSGGLNHVAGHTFEYAA